MFQLWEFVAVQERKSIESLLGVPLPNIPAIISALWRIDSLLLNVGLTLCVSSPLFQSPLTPSYRPSFTACSPPSTPNMRRNVSFPRSLHILLPCSWLLRRGMQA